MGEITDMILDGILCDVCGTLVIDEGEDAPGHPVTCDECKKELEEQ